jgi:putative heme-binding domain-containing protein
LATLEGFSVLKPELVRLALADKHPGVRRYAIRAAEPWPQANPAFWRQVIRLANDDDASVRQQVAYSVGQMQFASVDRKTATDYFTELLTRDAKDPYISAALFSSVNENNVDLVAFSLLSVKPLPLDRIATLLRISARLQPNATEGLLARILDRTLRGEDSPERKFSTAAALLEAASANEKSSTVLQGASLQKLQVTVTEAREFVALSGDIPTRIAAVKLLGVQPKSEPADAQLFAQLLDARHPPELQMAAAGALAAQFPDSAAKQLLAGWRSYAPALRTQILELLMSRSAWSTEFLAAVERGEVMISHIDARRRQQLVNHIDSAIREKASKLFANETTTSRAQVVEQVQNVLQLPTDVAKGKAAFAKKCANCHRLEETGQHVGPDLMALTDKSPRSLLVAILDPNKAVEDKFLDYVAVTTDGRQFTGMLLNETSTSLTLAGQEGKQVALNRSDLETFQNTGKSVMPEGLEKDLSPQELADVIAYVRGISAEPKKFPGNQPELAQVRDDGSIRLLAMNAKIYGPTLLFEEKYRNLGFWRSRQDHAIWMMNVPKAGKYRVSIDYACEDSCAGSRFIIAVGDQTVGGTVEGTGSWDNYRNRTLGVITLPDGPADLIMRSDGSIKSAMIDVRQIVLHPQ